MTLTRYQRCPTCSRQIARKRYMLHRRQHQLDRLMGKPEPYLFVKGAPVYLDNMATVSTIYFVKG